MTRTLATLVTTAAIATLTFGHGRAVAAGLPDAKVQAPSLPLPGRASLAGEYGKVAFAAEDLGRGSFSLPSTLALPDERGAPGASIFPTYAPGGGLSEWGMGFGVDLAITRFRVLGEPDYATDDLSSPWGRLVRGNDGTYYALGLSSLVRVETSGATLVAYLPDGTVETFGAGADRVDGPRGTYAWYLSDVRTAQGARTRLAWRRFGSARLYLDALSYGGRDDAGGPDVDFQYRVDVDYAPLARSFVDYRAGVAQRLDHRVSGLRMNVRHAVTGEWVERWRYRLGYQEDAWGGAFYLAEAQRTFASGESEPAVHYGYTFGDDALAAARFRRVAEVEALFRDHGSDAIQPDFASFTDVDEDGRLDVEHQRRNDLYVRDDAGFHRESLPAYVPGTPWPCRQAPAATNAPRLLAQMRPDTTAPEVVHLEPSGSHLTTDLYVCSREGALLDHQVLAGDWGLDGTTRLVDLDHDHLPDLVKVYPGGYEVLPNQSDAAGVRFGSVETHALDDFDMDTVWVQDLNGDGVVDLVARGGNTLAVWYGRTGRDFAGPHVELDFRTLYGWNLADLGAHELRFLDANHDGATDVLLVQGGTFMLYANAGTRFEEVDVPELDSMSSNVGAPVVADLAASGNQEVLFAYKSKAYSIAFDTPATGLLAFADDGKGNVLRFGYGRAPASPGAMARAVVLAHLEVAVGGGETVAYDNAYADAHAHARGRFLVGYQQIIRTWARGAETVRLIQRDDWGGLLRERSERDRVFSAIERFETRTFADASYRGVAWPRPLTTTRGFRAAGTSGTNGTGGTSGTSATGVSESDTIEAWYDEVCPARARHVGAHGTLVVERTRAELPRLGKHLHCIDAATRGVGTHAEAGWDFDSGQRIERDALGLPTRVWSTTPAGDLELQSVAYDPAGRVVRVAEPGHGASLFGYDAATGLIESATEPDGSWSEISERDPVTDAVRAVTSYRGERRFVRSFRYDGQERLVKHWDDLAGASEASPLEAFDYRFASATQPGYTHVRTLVDAVAGVSSESVGWSRGDGAALGQAMRRPEGWVFGHLVDDSVLAGTRRELVRDPLAPSASPLALDYAGVRAGARELSLTRSSRFDALPEQTSTIQTGVQLVMREDLALDGARLRQTTVENGTFVTQRWQGADRQVLDLVDQEGQRWTYGYDVLGRLRQVRLPSGATRAVGYDDHGRLAWSRADGVAALVYAYDALGQLASVTTTTPAGAPRRRHRLERDGLGRVVADDWVDLVNGAEKRVTRHYDDEGEVDAVDGPGFHKRFVHRADGALESRTLVLDGFRSVSTDLVLREDGGVAERATRVADADGRQLFEEHVAAVLDASGRELGLDVDGVAALRYTYDARGRARGARFAGGELELTHDPLSDALVGLDTRAAGWRATTTLTNGTRGFPEVETLDVGGVRRTRRYGYGARGFLASSADEDGALDYRYDADGLPELPAAVANATCDDTGALATLGDLTLAYGPDGQLASATRGGHVFRFVTDEDGRRLVKLADGVPVAGFVPEGYLDARRLVEPVRFDGSLVGVLDGGAFAPLPVDTRGTVLGDRDGRARLATPFGVRAAAAHPDRAAAIDFVQHAYDADLGLVRMGVRDYAPELARFTTPDPLFLEQPDTCLESRTGCTLYAYAGNNPLSHWDPDGHFDETVHGVVSYQLALAAGFTERDAAHLALATSGVDHDPATRPLSEKPLDLSNLFIGITKEVHFNREGALAGVNRQVTRGEKMDLNLLGLYLHGVEDMGYADAPGPHALGWHPLTAHGVYVTELGHDSRPWLHASDHAYENPMTYTRELQAIFVRVLVPAAKALYGDRAVKPDFLAAQHAIDQVTHADSYVKRIDMAVDKPAMAGGGHAEHSYRDQLDANHRGQAGFTTYATYPSSDWDIPIDD
jgi:RHS repeat-associated protein